MQLDFAQAIISAIPFGILPFMILLPLVGAFLALVIGAKPARYLTLIIGVIELALALLLAMAIDPTLNLTDPTGGIYGWNYVIATLGTSPDSPILQILLGIDGFSVVMIVLSNLVVLIAAISSNHIKKNIGMYYGLFMFMQAGLLGVFMAIDLFAFFVFWELVLIPMFFIVGKYGEEGCEHAAMKFVIYTHLGSAVMAISFFVLFFLAPTPTFNMVELRGMGLPVDIQIGFALAVFMGAGVKLPVFPLHNWLPWAHVKAPTPGSVILAGILLKMGGYAFIRLGLWMVPEGLSRLSIPFALLAVFTCIYAAFTAMAQTDMKSMVAYTSINHMSWVLLGVAVGAAGIGSSDPAVLLAASLALNGAIFMMFSHGTIISVMFLMAGQLKYATGTREIPQIKGLMTKAPKMSAIFILASLAAFGLPGFSGFIAEALTLFGSVATPGYIWTGAIGFGIFLTVGYLLWTLNRIVYSEPDPEKEIHEAPWSD
ncbi:MAG: NADH-quinone oxidoreductase subunit M, partial [Candidatus Thorarchaeota archaeon]|nr:NADH-quinone oxidoreductase subunit M [Candidatus Thorarchaeota archaeon]